MYYVYALYNKENDKIYIGQTSDLEKRIILHNSKIMKTSYTAHYKGSWEIIYQEKTNNRQEALIREKQLKSYQGRLFIRKTITLN